MHDTTHTGEVLESTSVTPTTSLDYGSHAALLGLQFNVVIASPYQACQDLSNADAVRGNVLIVGRGTCTFSEKVRLTHKSCA